MAFEGLRKELLRFVILLREFVGLCSELMNGVGAADAARLAVLIMEFVHRHHAMDHSHDQQHAADQGHDQQCPAQGLRLAVLVSGSDLVPGPRRSRWKKKS